MFVCLLNSNQYMSPECSNLVTLPWLNSHDVCVCRLSLPFPVGFKSCPTRLGSQICWAIPCLLWGNFVLRFPFYMIGTCVCWLLFLFTNGEIANARCGCFYWKTLSNEAQSSVCQHSALWPGQVFHGAFSYLLVCCKYHHIQQTPPG